MVNRYRWYDHVNWFNVAVVAFFIFGYVIGRMDG